MRRASLIVACVGLVLGLPVSRRTRRRRGPGSPASATMPTPAAARRRARRSRARIARPPSAASSTCWTRAASAPSTSPSRSRLTAKGPHAGVLATRGITGIIINTAGVKVTLRNLSIESPTREGRHPGIIGINVLNAAEVHIENCWIGRFTSHAISFNPSARRRALRQRRHGRQQRRQRRQRGQRARVGQPAQRLHQRRRRVRARERDRDGPRQHRRRRQCRVRGEHGPPPPSSTSRTSRRRTTPTGSWSPPARPCASATR